MTSDQIRQMTTQELREVANGMAYALGKKWADRTAQLIAVGELRRRSEAK